LTNRFKWAIPCTMNASEISSKINPRLNRIKVVSRIVRYALLAMFVFIICLSCVTFLSVFKDSLWFAVFFLGQQVVLCLWYWKLAQLFYFYERGVIFAPETIRCIKILGFLCMIGCIFKFITRIFNQPHPFPSIRSHLGPGITMKEISVAHFQMGFFSLDFGTGFDFGLLLAGVVIVLVAWIMDEGRKIQEEQELTV
jgi:hypothetical protein